MRKIIFLFLLLLSSLCYSQSYREKDSLYFLTSDLLFVPLKSSIIESKMGFTKFIDKKYLKLDIGASFDLAGLKTKNAKYSLGIDFLTFSNLRNEDNFKFPVDAIDYMFGLNVNFKKELSRDNTISGRLRFSHISSHLEDGHIYENTDTMFTPFVFSKEFIDAAVMDEFGIADNFSVKGLAAINFIFHAIPEDMSKLSGQLGIEMRYFFLEFLSVYLSNDVTIASVNSSTNVNESFEGGVSFGRKKSRALSLYFDYYDGQDYRGQYYGRYLNYKGLGMRFEF